MRYNLKVWKGKMYNIVVFAVDMKCWHEDGSHSVELCSTIHTNSLRYACRIIQKYEEYCSRCQYKMYIFDIETITPIDIYKNEETGEIEYSELTYAGEIYTDEGVHNYTDEDVYNGLLQAAMW